MIPWIICAILVVVIIYLVHKTPKKKPTTQEDTDWSEYEDQIRSKQFSDWDAEFQEIENEHYIKRFGAPKEFIESLVSTQIFYSDLKNQIDTIGDRAYWFDDCPNRVVETVKTLSSTTTKYVRDDGCSCESCNFNRLWNTLEVQSKELKRLQGIALKKYPKLDISKALGTGT